ncbi:hypothetical protein F4778DRAFT_754329 [Xylariomycetidae sp. FL2044]|nr:hypothetical protein F4778DRAFT_754329 [Xylariomycetidae sp. FL2044]
MSTSAVPCIFFRRGRCREGDACRFSHALHPEEEATAPQPTALPDRRSKIRCKFYLAGKCNKPHDCPYLHEEDPPSATKSSLPDDSDPFVRIFYGAIVRYGDGACVTNISLRSENSSLRLDNLPNNTTDNDLIKILGSCSHDSEIESLRIMPAPQPSQSTAYINLPDPEFARTLKTSLEDGPFGDMVITSVPPRLPSWASTRQVRCNKLRLRWSVPANRTCVLYYVSRKTARRVCGKFNSGTYEFRGMGIKSEEPTPIQNPLSFCHDTVWAVDISGLPYYATKEQVIAGIWGKYDSPNYVGMDDGPAWDEKEPTSIIKEIVNNVGPTEFITVPEGQDGSHRGAYVKFEQDYDAQEAKRVIERASTSSVLNQAQVSDLTVAFLYNASFKVSEGIYHHIQERLTDALDPTDAPKLSVQPRKSGKDLTIEDSNPETVAKYANAIEDIVAGELILEEDGEGPFWISELAKKGEATNILKAIQRQHGVLLLVNRSKSEIRFFGDPNKRASVQEDFLNSLANKITTRRTININADGVAWLAQTGFRTLAAEIGENCASLVATADSQRLVIIGSSKRYLDVLAMLGTNRMAASKDNCSICYEPAENPLVLKCGHTYCTDCFRNLCKNPSTDTDLSITCEGAEGKCKKAIPLEEIQHHVDRESMEQLLKSSFDTYISRRPNLFHYCPTPECDYLYRPARDSATFPWHMCPKCLKHICKSCRVDHGLQICADYQATVQASAFAEYKQQNSTNTKDCPKCETTVEKIDGCNHMQCTGCRTHFCWVCLASFEHSGECYEHMTEAHGGNGIEAPEEYEVP